jgi:isoquinoline 1-oxidoreductase alpha subunit
MVAASTVSPKIAHDDGSRRGKTDDRFEQGESRMTGFTINGRKVDVDAEPDTPLLWVIREHLKMTGTKFGCGIAQCGACTVHIEGEATRSCITKISTVAGKQVTTIEGLSPDSSHPLQKAWVAEQVPQCGYCQSGQIMTAATLLKKNAHPSRDEIVKHMDGNICRCGTYSGIIRAIQRASKEKPAQTASISPASAKLESDKIEAGKGGAK